MSDARIRAESNRLIPRTKSGSPSRTLCPKRMSYHMTRQGARLKYDSGFVVKSMPTPNRRSSSSNPRSLATNAIVDPLACFDYLLRICPGEHSAPSLFVVKAAVVSRPQVDLITARFSPA